MSHGGPLPLVVANDEGSWAVTPSGEIVDVGDANLRSLSADCSAQVYDNGVSVVFPEGPSWLSNPALGASSFDGYGWTILYNIDSSPVLGTAAMGRVGLDGSVAVVQELGHVASARTNAAGSLWSVESDWQEGTTGMRSHVVVHVDEGQLVGRQDALPSGPVPVLDDESLLLEDGGTMMRWTRSGLVPAGFAKPDDGGQPFSFADASADGAYALFVRSGALAIVDTRTQEAAVVDLDGRLSAHLTQDGSMWGAKRGLDVWIGPNPLYLSGSAR